MYKFVASISEYKLLESAYGTYQIVKDNKPVAHPSTEEDAWKRISFFLGRSNPEPTCWNYCRLHNCSDCERYD